MRSRISEREAQCNLAGCHMLPTWQAGGLRSDSRMVTNRRGGSALCHWRVERAHFLATDKADEPPVRAKPPPSAQR
eukprot:74268-Pleurochrysis_carterae.AAC.3